MVLLSSEFPSLDLCNPRIPVLQIIHVEFHVVVDIGQDLLSVTASIKLLPPPPLDVVFASALMTNTIKTRSFKPQDSRLKVNGRVREHEVGVLRLRTSSEIEIGSKDRIAFYHCKQRE